MGDRAAVHAVTATGAEVIRLDRSGQWFVREGDQRRRISLGQAVSLACAPGAVCRFGVRGGGSFDVGVRRQWRLRGDAAQALTT